MSKAETLAYDLEAEDFIHEVADKAAAELRRLAQMETEHVSLLKAISDAEPVAWSHGDPVTSDSSNVFLANEFRPAAEHADEWWPLYTLNGIKKP